MLILRSPPAPSYAGLRSTELEWTRKVSLLSKGWRFPAMRSCSLSPGSLSVRSAVKPAPGGPA